MCKVSVVRRFHCTYDAINGLYRLLDNGSGVVDEAPINDSKKANTEKMVIISIRYTNQKWTDE